MRPLKTNSFSDSENSMSVDVAGQQLTGSGSGHPFLHRAPARFMRLSRERLSAKSDKIGQFQSFQGLRRVRERLKSSFGESVSQCRVGRETFAVANAIR